MLLPSYTRNSFRFHQQWGFYLFIQNFRITSPWSQWIVGHLITSFLTLNVYVRITHAQKMFTSRLLMTQLSLNQLKLIRWTHLPRLYILLERYDLLMTFKFITILQIIASNYEKLFGAKLRRKKEVNFITNFLLLKVSPGKILPDSRLFFPHQLILLVQKFDFVPFFITVYFKLSV